jgi:hypothetical protein
MIALRTAGCAELNRVLIDDGYPWSIERQRERMMQTPGH